MDVEGTSRQFCSYYFYSIDKDSKKIKEIVFNSPCLHSSREEYTLYDKNNMYREEKYHLNVINCILIFRNELIGKEYRFNIDEYLCVHDGVESKKSYFLKSDFRKYLEGSRINVRAFRRDFNISIEERKLNKAMQDVVEHFSKEKYVTKKNNMYAQSQRKTSM